MELSFEQLLEIKVDSVYGASKFQQNVREAPSSVSIVTSDEIQKFGHRTLTDVLQGVRGMYVSDDRNYGYLGVRGFNRPGDYNSRVLVLVDGHRMNDSVLESALLGHAFPLDVDAIDRVEVIRGPSSSIYGNSAFFGVINVITKRGAELNGAVLAGEAGSLDSFKGVFSYGKKFTNDVEWFVTGSSYDSVGPRRLYYREYDDPATHDGIAEKASGEMAHRLFSSLGYRDWTLEGAYSSREKGVPTGSFGTTFNDRRSRTVDAPAFVDLQYRHEFTTQTEVIARTFYDYYNYYGDYPYAPVLNRDFTIGQRWGAEFQVNQEVFDRHRLTLGAEIHDNFQQDQQNYDVLPRTVYLDDRRATRNWALFGQGEVSLRTNVLFNAGVRYDSYETFGDSVNPRLGLIYSPVEPTTLKLLYGTAFRAPNAYELYYVGAGNKANPHLEPETIRTYELVVEQALPHHLHLSASGYYYEMDGLVQLMTDPADGLLVYRNAEQVTAHGAELELEGRYENGMHARIGYGYQETEDKITGEALSNSPAHLIKLGWIVPLLKDRIFAGLELQYTSAVFTQARKEARDFWTANLTLFSQKLLPGLEFSASLYNLFDARYGHPGGEEHLQDVIPQDGRTFRVKLSCRF